MRPLHRGGYRQHGNANLLFVILRDRVPIPPPNHRRGCLEKSSISREAKAQAARPGPRKM